jgi:hypothetical protein
VIEPDVGSETVFLNAMTRVIENLVLLSEHSTPIRIGLE